MSGTIIPQAVQTFVDINGKPYAGGSVYMYIPNTTTFKNTYQDPGQTILNTNPIILNGSGQAIIWGTGSYRQILKDQFGNLIWDQVTEDSTSGLLGDITDQRFVAGVDYTPGATTSLTLSKAPGTITNTWIYFDGVYQSDDTVASLTNTTLIFNSAIPVGVQEVNIKIGTTVAVGVISAGSVTDSSISTASILYRHVYSWVTSKDYGATGDGTTNDSANLLTANNAAFSANKPLVFVPGNYYIGTNTTFTADVYVWPGAQFTVPTGVTLAFSGIMDAPPTQNIFALTGTGVVTLNPIKTPTGYPEWWGAQTNNSAFDCSTAINASIAACRVTQLQCADYYLAAGHPILMQTPHRKLVGRGFYYENIPGTITGVWMNDGSTNVIVMGPNSQPASINDYMKELELENLFVSRTVAPVIASNCSGVLDRWTLYARKKNVKSAEHIIGFYYLNVVQNHSHQLWAFRSAAGTGPGTDYYDGYVLDGTNVIGSGGNLSLYMTECQAGTGGPSAPIHTATGFYLTGSFSDTFITTPETSACGTGIQFVMPADTTPNSKAVDVQITNPILDSCTLYTLFFNSTTEYGAITVLGGYGALSSDAQNAACIGFISSAAAVKIVGYQCIMRTSQAGTPGVFVTNSSNIDSSCIITECSGSALSLNNITNCSFNDRIVNYNATGAATGAVYGASNTSYVKYNVAISGKAAAWGIGYNMVGAGHNYNEWNCTGVNSAVATTKLIVNGTTITTQGVPLSNTTDYVSGVMV